jgi:hypothetical protein
MTYADAPEPVHFEVPDFAAAVRLTRRLGHKRYASLLNNDEVNIVTAEVSTAPNDLAMLLREVEKWVEEESLCAIRFLVDGRIYVLEAGGPDWTSDLWPSLAG